MEMSVQRAVQQALTPSKRKDGRLWKENRRLLSKSGENVCVRTSRMLSNLDISVKNAVHMKLGSWRGFIQSWGLVHKYLR